LRQTICYNLIPDTLESAFKEAIIIDPQKNIMSNTTRLKRKVAKKILVVEDEGEMRLVLDMILNERKFQLDYVNNLLSAEEYLQKQEPSVIILDNKLPDGFGVDFISYIRKKYPFIKIIMISGFASVRDVALENGADMFFEKPFSLEEFYEAIDRLLH
jgi:DNA-binding response OmpR family regulator